MKIIVIQKPATKARKGINPFTKLEQMFKAKPAQGHQGPSSQSLEGFCQVIQTERNSRPREFPALPGFFIGLTRGTNFLEFQAFISS